MKTFKKLILGVLSLPFAIITIIVVIFFLLFSLIFLPFGALFFWLKDDFDGIEWGNWAESLFYIMDMFYLELIWDKNLVIRDGKLTLESL
jgi:hypothetical protein